MATFSIGDKVRVISHSRCPGEYWRKTGTVGEISKGNTILVRVDFDDPQSSLKDGWVTPDCLEKVMEQNCPNCGDRMVPHRIGKLKTRICQGCGELEE